jgi:tetratricopeptide (TPR) repeat protein
MKLSAPVLSVERTAQLDVQNWREATRRFPRQLEATMRFASALLDAGDFEQALVATDGAIAKVTAAKPAHDAYDDADNMLTWIYLVRADSLRGLGRWSDAEAEYRKAMQLPERGGRNVSNTINLAGFYARGGRPDDALAALGPLARASYMNVSSYGMMQVKRVMCMVAVLKHDEGATWDAIGFLRKNRGDAPGTYQDTLLWTNRRDEWAQYMTERLRTPGTRADALRELQLYAEKPLQPIEQEMQKRLRELIERPDVRAAIAEVGEIGRFAIPPP